MGDFTDVEVRIRGERAGETPGLHDVEVQVSGSGRWAGQSRFQLDALDPDDPKAYGIQLGQQLANPSLVRALDQAGFTRNGNIRLRLVLDEDSDLHWIRWERVWLRIAGADQRLATYDRTLFSRYIPVERPDEEPPDALFFRLLYAIANPSGLGENERIKVEEEIDAFARAFETGVIDRRLRVSILPGLASPAVLSEGLKARIQALGWTLLPGATTVQNVAAQLADGYHGLHILAHGLFDPQTGIGRLLLERDDGGKSWTEDAQLQAWMNPQLQLVLLQACEGAKQQAEGKPPFTGIAPRLVQLGVPAVVAMQDQVVVQDARTFCASFYRTLLDDGFVDLAVNRARKRLIDADGNSDAFSIPALFTRLRGGKLWRADPLRQAMNSAWQALPRDVDDWPPLDVIEHTRGVGGYAPEQGAVGPRFDLWTRGCELAGTPGSFVVITGPSGSFRSAQLQRFFDAFTRQFRDAVTPNPPMPIVLSFAELSATASSSSSNEAPASAPAVLRRIWSGEQTPDDEAEIEGRRFLFLVDAEENPGGLACERALAAITRLKALPDSSIVLLADETLLPELSSPRVASPTALLVAQLLDWPKVKVYLDELGTPAAQRVRDKIRERRYTDLASHPRFLRHMLELSRRGVDLPSRCAILECVADVYTARTTRVPCAAVEAALRRMAWELQILRTPTLSARQVYPLLNEARGVRDVPLSDLFGALTKECRLLVPGADESVRFAYPPLQAYYAAQYLARLPNSGPVIEDVAASLGRLARVRRWEKVLVLLAGILPSPGNLLRTILAGSSLMEGEQLYVAARCYQEAIAQQPDAQADLEEVLDQMIDALMWRSSWDRVRPYGDRSKALTCLIELTTCCTSLLHTTWEASPPAWQREVVKHLVSLTVDPVTPATATQPATYDWSGMRRVAANGLLEMYKQTTQYVQTDRPELIEPLQAWWLLHESSDPMRKILRRDDPGISVVAAFALGQSVREEDRLDLCVAYEQVENDDVLWAIANALAGLDAGWLHKNVIARWKDAPAGEPIKRGKLRPVHVCHLVQRTSFAAPDVRERLAGWLRTGSPFLQGRVLRALGALQDADVEQWLRPLCEQIACGNLDAGSAARMTVTADSIKSESLQRAALETLRGIGDAKSMSVVRSSRATRGQSASIRQLSFQVVEEMYWRLTGGLDKETYTEEAFQRPTR